MDQAFLARKVIRSRWEERPAEVPSGSMEEAGGLTPPESIIADALLGLKSSSNTLSLWRCDGSVASLERVALAFAAGMKTLSRLEVAVVPERELHVQGLKIKATPGSTPVAVMRDHHRDLVGLTLRDLGLFARILAGAVRNGTCVPFTKRRVESLLTRALDAGLLEFSLLEKSLCRDLAEAQIRSVVMPVFREIALNHGFSCSDLERSGKGRLQMTIDNGSRSALVRLDRKSRRCQVEGLPRGTAEPLSSEMQAAWPKSTW